MKRIVLLLTGVVVLATGLVLMRPDAAEPPRAPSRLATAFLPALAVPVPEPEAPEARFTRSVLGPTAMPGSGVLLDLCQGPVGIDLGDDNPLLVAEHDYCGGSDWMWKLKEGDAVRLEGDGVEADTYVVTSLSNARRRQARVSDLPQDAEIVLQTCVSDTEIVLLGLLPYERV